MWVLNCSLVNTFKGRIVTSQKYVFEFGFWVLSILVVCFIIFFATQKDLTQNTGQISGGQSTAQGAIETTTKWTKPISFQTSVSQAKESYSAVPNQKELEEK